MERKRIAFFLASMVRGGAERVISILSNEYVTCNWNTDIGLLLLNKVEYDLDKRIRVLDFAGNITSKILRFPMWIKRIRNYVKTEKPDVIVSFTAKINVIVCLACVGLKTKIIVSERNDPKHDGQGFFTKVLSKILYPGTAKIIFQTERVKKQFSKKIQKNSVVIPNPISIQTEASDYKEKKIVSVGRLTKQKNQKMLLDAFASVVKKYPEYQLYIYGEGVLRQELTDRASDLGILQKVNLPGNFLNLHERISNAELFVLSSDYEGLSNALLEAMMMGLPCISTDCAGSDEYIRNGENGLLIPVGDTKALEEAMLLLIERDDLRQAYGLAAKHSSNQFCAQTVLKLWHDIIEG